MGARGGFAVETDSDIKVGTTRCHSSLALQSEILWSVADHLYRVSGFERGAVPLLRHNSDLVSAVRKIEVIAPNLHVRGAGMCSVGPALHEAILKVRQQHFDGQIVLYADCAAKLNKQLEMADFALELHNSIAEQLKLPALTKDSIYEGLQPRGRVSCHPVERYC
jgi:hypothetical protein